MGVVTSRIALPLFWRKKPEAYRKELEEINKQLFDLQQKKTVLHYHHTVVLELIVTYSRILYVLVALVFFLSTLPSSFIEYVLFCGPLIIFHFLVYALKAAVKWYYENEVKRNAESTQRLQFKKKNLLAKVKETTQFKEAKDIIETYGPEKPVIIMDWKSPVGTNRKSPQYLDNVVSYVLGEKKDNSLICAFCQWHNGMALQEDWDYLGLGKKRCTRFLK